MGIKGVDLTGQKFNRLTVLGRAEPRIRPNGTKRQYWKCQCDCGVIKEVDTQSLKNGSTKSCGCWHREKSRKDLTGQRFGRLTVIRFDGVGTRSSGQKYCNWLCKCDCGNEITVQTTYLTLGETKSCGCLKEEVTKLHYEGQRFGKLTVIREDGRDKRGCVIWLCKCDCGNDFRTTSIYLRRGYSTSCGCATKEKLIEAHKTHGLSDERLYGIWSNMKDRCYNPKNKRFSSYGGRGIIVCDDWKNNFESFHNWAIATGYDPFAPYGECTLDRIDVNKGYRPENCRWVTNKKQQNNRRDNHFIEYNGETRTLTEWAEIFEINPKTLSTRIRSRWSIKDALETPVATKFRRKVNVSA